MSTELDKQAREFWPKWIAEYRHLVGTEECTATAFAASFASQVREQSKWVSVEDSVPNVSGSYIVTFFTGTVSGSCWWNAANEQWGTNKDGSSWKVTHWMPQPKQAHGDLSAAPPQTTEQEER